MLLWQYNVVNQSKQSAGTFAEIECVHLNYREYADQWGALVFIHRGWGNKTEAFEKLVGVRARGDTWGV